MSDFENDNQQVTHYDPVAEANAATDTAKQEGPDERNWKQMLKQRDSMREENERIRREAEDLKRQLEAARGDDDLVEQRHLKAAINKIQADNLDMRLKSKFPDFDQVVNSQALKKLAQEDPELAYAIDSTQDMYAKAVSAYKMIKSRSTTQTYSEEDERFEENSYKPRSSNSLNPGKADSPISQANAFQRGGISQEEKLRHYREMQEAIKNHQN